MTVGSDEDVQVVHVGRRRRPWVVAAVAGIALWVAVAVVTGGGGEPETTVPTTPSNSPSTSSTLPPGPLLGAPTGWSLVASEGETSRVVDLDTGGVDVLPLGEVLASRHDGVLTLGADGFVRWRPFPFDEATVVRLEVGGGDVRLDPVAPFAWTRPADATDSGVRLVSLEDGSLVPIPAGVGPLSSFVGVAGSSLVVAAGGDTFVVDGDGAVRRLADGEPLAVAGDRVLVLACEDDLDCRTQAYPVDGGEPTDVVGLGTLPWYPTGPASPGGWLPAIVPGGGVLLLGPDGDLRGLPDAVDEGRIADAAWSPDGQRLFVPSDDAVVVVEPFVAGGARVLATFPLAEAASVRLAVVQPPPED